MDGVEYRSRQAEERAADRALDLRCLEARIKAEDERAASLERERKGKLDHALDQAAALVTGEPVW